MTCCHQGGREGRPSSVRRAGILTLTFAPWTGGKLIPDCSLHAFGKLCSACCLGACHSQTSWAGRSEWGDESCISPFLPLTSLPVCTCYDLDCNCILMSFSTGKKRNPGLKIPKEAFEQPQTSSTWVGKIVIILTQTLYRFLGNGGSFLDRQAIPGLWKSFLEEPFKGEATCSLIWDLN